jgi:outer membrane protein OmpA-like peptidoglycan-associated protein
MFDSAQNSRMLLFTLTLIKSRLNYKKRKSIMRTAPVLSSLLGATLLSVGVVPAHAAEGVFYDPSNAASPTGYTIGYELFRTIGCPGRELLATPCPVPAPPAPVAAAPEPAPAPAYVAPAPAPAYVAPAALPQKLVLEGVNFDFDKSTIRQEDLANIDKDVATLESWGNVNIEVAGHTDSRGSDAYNIKLSQRRAEAVRDYLISKGIAADRLSAKGYGESQPVADNATDEGRFKNRRVELVPLR